MCNWTTNRLKIIGEGIKEKLEKHFIIDEHSESTFDFNTIIPMPDDLNIEVSSNQNDGYRLYYAKVNPWITNFGSPENKFPKDKFQKIIDEYNKPVKGCEDVSPFIIDEKEVERLRDKYKDNLDEVIALGEKAYNNTIKYGCRDWFSWRLKYWGVKWNSSNAYHNDDYSEIYFDTPWSPSILVIKALAKMYPDLTFIHEWAEEQTGWYSGKYTYKNGELAQGLDYESYSKEAYELSFELWGNDEQYRYNPEIDNYEYIEDES